MAMLQLATQHHCCRWLVNLRHVENSNVPLLHREVMDGFIQVGLQLTSTGPLRVAVMAPLVPFTD
jgi:hypothetical protein